MEKVSTESFGYGYRIVVFDAAFGANEQPIYHTNVMMWIGSKVAAVCLECISDIPVRKQSSDLIAVANEQALFV